MIRGRKDFEKSEEQTLADYAVKSNDKNAIRRDIDEKEAIDRTAFQRDRDRIIYSKAFMRLKGKTQVVLADHGDHYRTRLTHTHYVATVSRDIARRLGLNEDLAEAIALGHDLGHTCFGHEGEKALNEMMKKFNSHFEHNEQSLWVVERLEKGGLNLTQAVRDGLDKHRTVFDNPESQNDLMPSLEAQVVNIADEIAYKFHDIDDGLRAEVFTDSDLKKLSIWKSQNKSKFMEIMIDDLVNNTDIRLSENNIHSSKDVYSYAEELACFSNKMQVMVNELGDFLMEKFYKSEQVRGYNDQGRQIVTFLFNYFCKHPEEMPSEFRSRLNSEKLHVIVKDYVAGMTDKYAIDQFNKYNG